MNRINELSQNIIKFRDERDWKKFHTLKDLAISISIESGELLECFQWKNLNSRDDIKDDKLEENIKEEMADISIYLLTMCNDLGYDICDIIEEKLKKNNLKYPVKLSKGNSKKYTEWSDKIDK